MSRPRPPFPNFPSNDLAQKGLFQGVPPIDRVREFLLEYAQLFIIANDGGFGGVPSSKVQIDLQDLQPGHARHSKLLYQSHLLRHIHIQGIQSMLKLAKALELIPEDLLDATQDFLSYADRLTTMRKDPDRYLTERLVVPATLNSGASRVRCLDKDKLAEYRSYLFLFSTILSRLLELDPFSDLRETLDSQELVLNSCAEWHKKINQWYEEFRAQELIVLERAA